MKIISFWRYGFWLILLGLNLSGIAHGQSNEGTLFWFSFLEHIDANSNRMVAMISSRVETQGIIEAPNAQWSQSFTTTPGSTTIIQLPRAAQTVGSERIQGNGIKVLSEDPISLYIHQYSGMRSEASLVLPKRSLGRNYYVISYEGITSFQGNESYPSEFLVLGVEDETQVTLTYADRTMRGRNAGASQTITLDAGETFQVQADRSSGDLTGSFIEADKPVAVFSGNAWTEVPTGCTFRDNLLEQMYPVSTWGRQYVAAPSAHLTRNVYRIIAANDQTQVEVFSRNPRTYTLDAGDFTEFQLMGEGAYILASGPILVAQYITGESCNGHNIGDPSMLLLNSIEQYRDTVTLFNSSFENITENYITGIIKTDDTAVTFIDDLRMVDQALFSGQLGPNGAFTYLTVPVSPGPHNLISLGCGIIATAYGYGPIESYAYGGGASFLPVNANAIPEGGCLNDTIVFDTGLSPFQNEFFWDLGDGTTSTEAVFEHIYDSLGFYPVQLIVHNLCLETRDTFYRDVGVTLRQAVSTLPDTAICEGDLLMLGATDLEGARYEWEGPDDFFSEEQFPIIDPLTLNAEGSYEVIGYVSGCGTFPQYMNIEVYPMPEPDFNIDSIYCHRDGPVLLDPGSFVSYFWQDGSSSPTYETIEEGVYSVLVTDDQECVNETSIRLQNRCPTAIYVPNVFTPNRDGINDQWHIAGNDLLEYHLLVYDRWGNTLFQSRSVDQQWDGTVRGKLADPGVYAYRIYYVGFDRAQQPLTQVLSGTVTLLR